MGREVETKLISREPYELHIVVPHLPKRINRLLGSSKFTNMRHATGWRNLMAAAVRYWKPQTPLARAQLKLRRYGRCLDYDSLVMSFKAPVDGLKRAGVIVDDRWSVTGRWDVDQEYAPEGDQRIEIFVTELPTQPKETRRGKTKSKKKTCGAGPRNDGRRDGGDDGGGA